MAFIVSEQKTLTSKAQFVLDKRIRKQMGLKPGDKLMEVYDGKWVFLVPVPKDPAKALLGILKDSPCTSQEIGEWLDEGELD